MNYTSSAGTCTTAGRRFCFMISTRTATRGTQHRWPHTRSAIPLPFVCMLPHPHFQHTVVHTDSSPENSQVIERPWRPIYYDLAPHISPRYGWNTSSLISHALKSAGCRSSGRVCRVPPGILARGSLFGLPGGRFLTMQTGTFGTRNPVKTSTFEPSGLRT